MAFCGKCGSMVADGTAFCNRCGAPLASATPPAGGASAATGLSSNIAGLLCYILGFVTGIVFLVLDPYKNDPFVRFHAYQSIFFSLVVIAFQIVWGVVFGTLLFSFMFALVGLLSTIISLAFFAFWLFLMYKAYNNERYMIPFIGELAAKQAG